MSSILNIDSSERAKITPVQLRQWMHQNPELMFEEFETTRIIRENIKQLSLIKIHQPLPTGLVVEYTVNKKPYLLFRADIDALPIAERTNYAYSSNNNKMHACGHDLHASILYGFLLEVVEKEIDQNIIFVFQPAEEGGGGADMMLRTGVFDHFNIKAAFALHVTDEYDYGVIATTPGIFCACSWEVDLIVNGRSAHIAEAHLGIDSLKVLRELLDKIDLVVSNAAEPILFGCGKITGGTARNILASESRAECTLRSLYSDAAINILSKIELEAEELRTKTGAQINVSQKSFYPEVLVDKTLYDRIKSNLARKHSVINSGTKMTAEDFGYFSKKYPSFMFWLGTSEGKRSGLHTPSFLPDDKVIQKGIDIYKQLLEINTIE